jgi:hypothetical protein
MTEGWLERTLERCIKELKDRKACEFMYRVFKMIEELRLEECVAKNDIDKCFDACMKSCKNGNCDRLCEHAVDHAAVAVIARKMLLEAARIAARTRAELLGLLAVEFASMLERFIRELGDCRQKERAVYLFSTIAVELAKLVGSRELVLLIAPVLALTRECIEGQIDGVLETVRIIAGEEYAARIAAALEEGAVKIGSAVIRFPSSRREGYAKKA